MKIRPTEQVCMKVPHGFEVHEVNNAKDFNDVHISQANKVNSQ